MMIYAPAMLREALAVALEDKLGGHALTIGAGMLKAKR